jgi:hypothetical protein
MLTESGEEVGVVFGACLVQDAFYFLFAPAFATGLTMEGSQQGEGIAVETDQLEVDFFRDLLIHDWLFGKVDLLGWDQLGEV